MTFPSSWLWFQGPNPTFVLSSGTPRITGHLVGQPATTLTTGASTYHLTSPIIHSRLQPHPLTFNLPKPGCWQITVKSGSQSLTITAWAIPFAQRPAIKSIIYQRQVVQPYPAPSSCRVTNWAAPSPGNGAFSIESHHDALFMGVPVFFADNQTPIDVINGLSSAPKISGKLAGNSAAVVRSGGWIVNTQPNGIDAWQGTVNFSTAGCWQIQVPTKTTPIDATIYVYPHDCIPTSSGARASSCTNPAF